MSLQTLKWVFLISLYTFLQLWMSGKREASYTIDPNTLQQKQKDQQQQPQDDSKAQRVPKQIFKIKRSGQSQVSQQKQTKVSFKLNQSQQIKQTGESHEVGQTRQDDNKQKPVTNPFANLFKSDNNIFQGVGIFSNLKSTNLFASNQGTQETSRVKENSNGSGGLLVSEGPRIFDSSSKGTSPSLFGNRQAANNQEEGSGDSAQLQKTQEVQSDPRKSKTNFSYDESCPVLLTLRAAKFKKSGGQLIQNVQIVIQKQKQTEIKYISVRLPAMKKNIYSGILVQGRSEFRHLHGRKQNVQVASFFKQKGTFMKVILKFQFQNPEDGQRLFERLQELLGNHQQRPKQSAHLNQ